MSITYNVLDFPAVGVKGQLFYAPGAFVEGGITSGGAMVSTFEPGGFAMLDISLARRDEDVSDPELSWLMSQTNGQIFRVPLTATPQILTERDINAAPRPSQPVTNLQRRALRSTFTSAALKGSRTVTVRTTEIGPNIKRGHLIGHDNNCYMVDSVTYTTGTTASLVLNPPLRNDVAINDTALFTPFFTGVITNGSEIRAMYERSQNGGIELSTIKMREVVL